jgi:molybdate transport system ATP-binding protein
MALNANSSKPFLTLDGITIRLRDRFVFEDTFWQLKSDEQWAVIGPNGAGKSTLVKALVGDLPIVRGRAIYHFLEGVGRSDSAPCGRVARVAFDTERDFHASNAGFEPFSSEQDGKVTVAQSILRGSSTGDVAEENDLGKIAKRLGIEHLMGRANHLLSSGEAKKVLLARALLRSPNLLILDEPFEGLDEKARIDLKELIDSLMTGLMRVVLVTHRFEEISPKVSHVLCVKNCRAIMQGPAQEVLRPDKISEIFEERGFPEVGQGFYLRAQEKMQLPLPRELIVMKNTTVGYGGHLVLDHIDWTVRRGENWVVLGPNGAGKSKLLELITGDNVQGYANDIHLFGMRKGSGESIWEIKEKLSMVSAEFQMTYQKPIPAYDVICSGFFDSIGLYRSCTQEQHQAVRKMIGLLGIKYLVRRPFDQLSHGQQRLILLARAMVKSPLLLILDEPCDGLDYANRRNIREFIEFIGSKTATGLIYVTHHEDEIPSCITHALVLDRGKIVAAGPRLRSPGRHASVHRERNSVDEGGFVGCEV